MVDVSVLDTERPAYTIRPLTVEELPLCEPFARAFHAEKEVPGAFSMEVFTRNWTTFLTSYPATILTLWNGDRLVGGLGGMVFPDLLDGRFVATEMFWYVTPDARIGRQAFALVDAFERWAAEKGAVEVRMMHLLRKGEDPATVRLAPIYRRRGYRAVEVGYVKTLSPPQRS